MKFEKRTPQLRLKLQGWRSRFLLVLVIAAFATLAGRAFYLQGMNTTTERLCQIIGNLVDNAVKFVNGGREVTVSLRAADGRAELRVRDRGVGIEPEMLGRLFQPFPQIVDSGKAWWFVCPPSSASRPKTRAFEEWLVEELSAPPVRSGRPIAVARRSA